MIYETAKQWLAAPQKRVVLFGMSGLGKTRTSKLLRKEGWFHYSVDYRIGTRYMGEYIVDNFKKEAMKVPFLAELLRSDSIYVASNITFENLDPLSTYLGKPGDPARGGLAIQEYNRRQAQHHAAEVPALLDTGAFITRAQNLYGYDKFVCDTGGSICEVVDPQDPNDPVLSHLSQQALMVWIKGDKNHEHLLKERFAKQPKPMCYRADFLHNAWKSYLAETKNSPDAVDPDAFMRWTYAKAISRRAPIYERMAEWGVTVSAEDVFQIRDGNQFEDIIAAAIERRGISAS